jgi:Zn finger protein HypA/HybF involved in hydrogenase expression
MVGEVFAGIGALKTAFDMAKGLNSIHDAVARDRAVIELQKEILAAQAAQSNLIESVGELKRRVAELESWEAEKQRYELSEIGAGTVCYIVKAEMRGREPIHRICANCYAGGKKSFLQQHVKGSNYDKFVCNSCGETLGIDKGDPPQPHSARPSYEY